MRDVDRAQQNRQGRERALAAEKERERQAHLASQHVCIVCYYNQSSTTSTDN